jgi:hypothetical protein
LYSETSPHDAHHSTDLAYNGKMAPRLAHVRRLVGDIAPRQYRHVDVALAKDVGVFTPVSGQCDYATSPRHTHPSYSFVLSFDGATRMLLDGRIHGARPGELSGVAPGIPHQELVGDQPPRYAAIMIAPRFLLRQLRAYPKATLPPLRGETWSAPSAGCGAGDAQCQHDAGLDLSTFLAHNRIMSSDGTALGTSLGACLGTSDTRRLVLAVAIAWLAGCGREPLMTNTGGGEPALSGGTTAIATGGTSSVATGGAAGEEATSSGGYLAGGAAGATPANGGAAGAAKGGAAGTTSAFGGAAGAAKGGAAGTTPAFGGAAGAAKGGAAGTPPAFGGAAGAVAGGAGGTPGAGGSQKPQSCTGVVCGPIPSSCRKLIQEPGACCPTCTDTGCNPCPALTCPTGTHQETLAGDCCPSCVANPPDPCLQGKQNYAAFRQQLFDKYASSGCKNSSDCILVFEGNACAQVCSVPLPTTLASSFSSNLFSIAATDCATCPPPATTICAAMTAACLNGKCVATSAL